MRVILALVLIAIAASQGARGQDHEIIREVMGSGGEIMRSDEHTAHGTISQTTIGRVVRPNGFGHNIGFWYWAKRFGGFACVRIPRLAADAGAEVKIPLILEESNDLYRNGAMRWRARIRFNGTLLEPVGLTPQCEWEGEDCIIEIEGTAVSEVGLLAELDFVAKLGNNISTPLFIEEFTWLDAGERRIETVRKHGEFTLLGVCREGESTRLVFSNGLLARVTAMPNPASDHVTIEFVTGEGGRAKLSLVDGLGIELAVIAEQEVVATETYQVGLDLTPFSSGTYFLVLQAPTVVRSTPLIIQQ